MFLYNFETFPIYNGVIDHKSLCRWFGSVPGYDVFKAAKQEATYVALDALVEAVR